MENSGNFSFKFIGICSIIFLGFFSFNSIAKDLQLGTESNSIEFTKQVVQRGGYHRVYYGHHQHRYRYRRYVYSTYWTPWRYHWRGHHYCKRRCLVSRYSGRVIRCQRRCR